MYAQVPQFTRMEACFLPMSLAVAVLSAAVAEAVRIYALFAPSKEHVRGSRRLFQRSSTELPLPVHSFTGSLPAHAVDFTSRCRKLRPLKVSLPAQRLLPGLFQIGQLRPHNPVAALTRDA